MSSRQLPLFPDENENALTRHSSIQSAVAPFEHHLRSEGRSPHTISAFLSDMGLVIEFLGEDVPLKAITTSILNRFMEWVENGRGVPCSRKSYARRVTTLKVFFGFLKNEGIIDYNPAESVLQRSGAAPLQPILTDEQLEQLIAQTARMRVDDKKPDARPELLLRLLLETAIKKSECMRLTREDIDRLDPNGPILIVRHRTRGNVYKERKISLDPSWPPLLDEYLAQYEPKETIFDCTARNLEYVLHDIADGAGVEAKISFEILRWTSAVRDYKRGTDLEKLREKMGLSRISWRETSDKIKRLAVGR